MVRPLAVRRHNEIVQRLRAAGSVSVGDLAKTFSVSHETIRRDLKLLADQGHLDVVHGGAARRGMMEPPIAQRIGENAEGKAAIARTAAGMVQEAACVLVDSGTTTEALAASLPPGVSLVAITNALPIALALMSHPQLTVHLLGGRIRTATLGTVDSWALRNLHDVQADVAFVGANAFTVEHGLSTPDSSEAALKGAMVESARLTVLMADHTKFGRDAVFKYADLQAVDILITDEGMSAADAHALQSAGGIEVLRV